MFIHLSSLYTHELIHLYSSQIPIRRSSQTFIRPHLVFLLLLHSLRKFKIKHSRYAFCRVALVGEKAISLPVQSCSEGMGSWPELLNHPLRRSHFHRSENPLAKP